MNSRSSTSTGSSLVAGKHGRTIAIAALVVLLAALGMTARQVFVAPQEQALSYLGVERMDQPAPDLAFEDRSGKLLRLQDLRGRTVFLNFWATWCGTCRQEMPSMDALGRRLGREGLVMLAASVDEGWEPIETFRRDAFGGADSGYQIVLDRDSKAAKAFGTSKFPETYVIGPDGRIKAKFVGPRNWNDEAFELYLREMLPDARHPPA